MITIQKAGAQRFFDRPVYKYVFRLVRLSVRMEQLGSQWTDFHDI